MRLLNEFIDDITTLDYGFLLVGIHHLEFVSETWEPLLGKENATVMVACDWDNAIWEHYSSTDFGREFRPSSYASQFWDTTGEVFYKKQIDRAVSELLTLPIDQIKNQLTRLLILEEKIIKAIDPYFLFTAEHLDQKIISLRDFNYSIQKIFNTINYPPFGQKDQLYVDNSFIRTADLLVFRKASAIQKLIDEVEQATGIGPDMQVLYPDARHAQAGLNIKAVEQKDNDFNAMPMDDVRRFFMLLTTNNKEGRPFLSESNVDRFINRAFKKAKDIDPLTLDIPQGQLGVVGNFFYWYYNHCTTHHYPGVGVAAKNNSTQEYYINLLVGNFLNYNFTQAKSHFRDNDKWKNRPLSL